MHPIIGRDINCIADNDRPAFDSAPYGETPAFLTGLCVQGVNDSVCPFQNSVKIGKTNSPEFCCFSFLPPIFMRLCPKRRTCIKINHLRNARILRIFTSLNFGKYRLPRQIQIYGSLDRARVLKTKVFRIRISTILGLTGYYCFCPGLGAAERWGRIGTGSAGMAELADAPG